MSQHHFGFRVLVVIRRKANSKQGRVKKKYRLRGLQQTRAGTPPSCCCQYRLNQAQCGSSIVQDERSQQHCSCLSVGYE